MACLRMRSLFLISLMTGASADLRFASWAKSSYKLRQDQNGNNGNQLFVDNANDVFYKYMEPSTFEYQGLSGNNGQKRNNYDQFLRSNIDNEQDNRDFNRDEGCDHMPFRTLSTTIQTQENAVDLIFKAVPGKEQLIPLRWNNPHSSEIEANIWIHRCPEAEGAGCEPVVVPIAKPCCSGEGYQNNVFRFVVPLDFNSLSDKIPGFTGCIEDSKVKCVVQVYAHSVESRMYSYGFPIYIETPNGQPLTPTATSMNLVQGLDYCPDPRMDLTKLANPICISCLDKANVDVATSIPQLAKLVSDVANHAFQNSDFSPYSGQQHCLISKNLQASAVNKMATGNRGELGKASLPQGTKNKLNQLAKTEDKVYKKYEALANNLINRYGRQMKETGELKAGQTTQPLSNVFRARQVGSTKANRQQTNTYIPSFQLSANLIEQAKERIPDKYQSLINGQGLVQIYVSAMNDLMPLFEDAAKEYGILYQPNQAKDSFTTKASATQFKKRDANGKTDGGVYAGTLNRKDVIAARTNNGCSEQCLYSQEPTAANGNKRALFKDSEGTSVQGACLPCAQMFTNAVPPAATPPPTPIGNDLIANPVADLPETPDVDPVADYPDEDGTERVGRPPSPSTTTKKIWYSPGPWMSSGGGGGGVGVVGGATRAGWDVSLLCFVSLFLIIYC